MTSKKKLKRAIRAHAFETGTSYSTARRAFGVSPPASPAPTAAVNPDADQPPVEEVRQGPMHDVPGEFITFRLPDRRYASVGAPSFAVGYAVLGDGGSEFLPLQVEVPLAIVYCRTTSLEEWPGQIFRLAAEQYPELRWQKMSATKNPPMNGAPTRYWVQWLTLHADGSISWDRGHRGIRSLDDVLKGRRGPTEERSDSSKE